jgi:shikimate kinase
MSVLSAKSAALVLVGMPGSGKSTIGRRLANRLQRPFVDADAALEERCGVSVATVFDIEGESGFRERESRLLADLLAQPDAVIATGGGVVVTEANRDMLRRDANVIYLQTSLAELWIRLQNDRKRPLLQGDNPKQRLADLLATRESLYESVADVTVRSRRQSAERMTGEIMRALRQADIIAPGDSDRPAKDK